MLRDLLFFGVDVAMIQETHFSCEVDARVLSSDCCLFSVRGPTDQRVFLAGEAFTGCDGGHRLCRLMVVVGRGRYCRE